MNRLIYKLATTNKELQGALEVRTKVFVEEQGISQKEEYDGYDNEALHVVAMNRGKVIGTARIRFLFHNRQMKIERMAILLSFRRRGIGRGMLSFLNKKVVNKQADELVLHAQHSVMAFYKSCGFKETGLPFIEARLKHTEMTKQITERIEE
jgi:predicted GNAT family N-acyltransferase